MHLVSVRFKAWQESLDDARSMRGERTILSPTAQWVSVGPAVWEQAVDGSRLFADLAHTR